MYKYLFLTAVAILMFFTVTHAQGLTRAQDSSHTSDSRTTDMVTLGIGFGQDYGFS